MILTIVYHSISLSNTFAKVDSGSESLKEFSENFKSSVYKINSSINNLLKVTPNIELVLKELEQRPFSSNMMNLISTVYLREYLNQERLHSFEIKSEDSSQVIDLTSSNSPSFIRAIMS